MPDASLLTDDVRALIGVPTAMDPVQITLRAVRRALDTYTGSRGGDFADGAPVPGYVIAALDSESEPPPIPLLLPKSLLISNEWQFERPLRLGEQLDVSYRIVDISERFGGKFGYSLDFRTEREFRDATGTVVARTAHTMMQYDVSQPGADARA